MLKFKGQSSVFLIAMLMIIAILMAMSLMATANAASTANAEVKLNVNNGEVSLQKTTNLQYEVSAKFKKAKTYTLTFNPNGGKVSKKSVELPYKKTLGTLPKPTRSGYTFQGWYTQKKAGKKVSKTSKMSAKNTMIYAHWKPTVKARTLNAYEKELVGTYTISGRTYDGMYEFKSDGTYTNCLLTEGSGYGYTASGDYGYGILSGVANGYFYKGNWAVTNKGKIQFTNTIYSRTDLNNPSNSFKNKLEPNRMIPYEISVENGETYLAFHGGTTWYTKQK